MTLRGLPLFASRSACAEGAPLRSDGIGGTDGPLSRPIDPEGVYGLLDSNQPTEDQDGPGSEGEHRTDGDGIAAADDQQSGDALHEGGDDKQEKGTGAHGLLFGGMADAYQGPPVDDETVDEVRARVLAYVRSIVDKRTVAGKWILRAAERFLRQLEDARFVMDWRAAARPVRFCERLAFDDAGEEVRLEDWQVWATAVQYGLKWASDGRAVVSLTVCQVARGAGKTTWAAALALYEFKHGPRGGRQHLIANKREQTDIAFEAASNMFRLSFAEQAEECMKHNRFVDKDRNVRLVQTASKDRTLDGLKPTFWFGDEASEWRGRFIVKVTTAAAKMKRSRGLICTTPGDNADLIYTAEILEVAYRVLDGELDLPHQFYLLFGLDEEDEPENEAAWIKANPGLPRLPTLQGLRNQWATARLTPQGRAEFIRFHGARFARSASRWLDMAYWDEARDERTLDEIAGRPAWGGLDLSKSGDLAAFVLAVPLDDGRIALRGKYWWPKRAARNREVEYGIPLRQWEAERRIVLTEGDEIDYDQIRGEIQGAARLFDLRIVGYDAWGSAYLAQTLEKTDGITLGRYSMGIANIGPATQEWQRHWLGRRFIHNNDPVLRRCCADAAAKRDDAGNIRPIKSREKCAIDGLIASVIAVHCWALTQDGGVSDYEFGAAL